MNPLARRLACLALFAAPLALARAEDVPTLTISKGDTLAIALDPFAGPDAATVAKVVQNDLSASGLFSVTDAAKAGFRVSGASAANGLEGKVTDAGGRVALAKSYPGTPRERAHAFADDIVETLTGKPGFASSRIAFVATRSGRKEIYTADADGANVRQLTRDNAISVGPSLSPDGSRLAYTGYQSGYADIYLIDIPSGRRDRIVKFPGTNTGAMFSPDGRQIAASLSKDGNPELYVLGASGGGARRLTRTRGVESSPTWSPDGSELIYSSDDRGTPQLYRIPAGGGAPRPISTGHGYNTEPNWSPDGRKVAFNVRGAGFQVAVLDIPSGSVKTVGPGEDPVWSKNSRHLYCADGSSLILVDTQSGKRTAVVTGLGKISEPTCSR